MLQQTNQFMRVGITLLGLALLGAALVLTVGTSTAAETREIVRPSTLTFPGDEITVKALNTISTTSNFVLFSQPTGQEGTIWLLEEGITETAVITGYRPRLSPDGQSIIYLAGDSDPVRGDIYVYDLTTDTSTQIFSNWDSIVYYAWSADSNRIFYDFRCKIYAMDPDGSNNEEIISDWIGSGIDYCYNDHPDVNPIDGRLAWENERYGLGVAASDGSNPGWITNTQPGDFDPRWSPDGQWIAFFRDSDAADDDNFFKIRPDGSQLTQLTFLAGDDTNEMEQLGGWSADGKFIVGAGEVGGVQALYAVDANGTGLTVPLLKEAGADQYFVGNAGILDIDIYSVYLPLTLR